MRRRARYLGANALLYIGLLLILLGVLDLIRIPRVQNHAVRIDPLKAREDGSTADANLQEREGIQRGSRRCAITKAGRELVADSLGYVCRRTEKEVGTGCCAVGRRERFSCATCTNQSGCCGSFERCVSCCMSPSNAELRGTVERRRGLAKWGLEDAFDLCRMACRTSSNSVVHENAYRHERHHCYGYVGPSIDPELHQGIFNFAKPVGVIV